MPSFSLRFSPHILIIFGLALVSCAGRMMWIAEYGGPVPRSDDWRIPQMVILPWIKGELEWSDLYALHVQHRIVWMRILSLISFLLNDRQWDIMVTIILGAMFVSGALVCVFASISQPAPWYLVFIAIFLVVTPNFLAPSLLWGFILTWYLLVFFTVAGICLVSTALSWKWWTSVILVTIPFFSIASVGGLVALFLKECITIFRNRNQHTRSVTGGAIILGIIWFCASITVSAKHSGQMLNVLYDPYHILDLSKRIVSLLGWPFRVTFDYQWIAGLFVYSPVLIFLLRHLYKRDNISQEERIGLMLGLWIVCHTLVICIGRKVGYSLNGYYAEVMPYGVLGNALLVVSWRHRKDLAYRKLREILCVLWLAGICVGLGNTWKKEMSTPVMYRGYEYNEFQEGSLNTIKQFIRGEIERLDHKFRPYPGWIDKETTEVMREMTDHKIFSYHFYLDVPYREINGAIIWSLVQSGQIGILSIGAWLLLRTWVLMGVAGIALIVCGYWRQRLERIE